MGSPPQVNPATSIRADQAVPTEVALQKFPALWKEWVSPLLTHRTLRLDLSMMTAVPLPCLQTSGPELRARVSEQSSGMRALQSKASGFT